MTRFLPWIARPIVKVVAANEIIACGLMLPGQKKPIGIYNPNEFRDYRVTKKSGRSWVNEHTEPGIPYVGNLIISHVIPLVAKNDIVRIVAKRQKSGLPIRSPKITVRMNTDYPSNMLVIDKREDGHQLSWKKLKKHYKCMIFFVSILDENDEKIGGMLGCYTRDTKLTLPKLSESSLRYPKHIVKLKKGSQYRARVLVVDYEGWVPAAAEALFTY